MRKFYWELDVTDERAAELLGLVARNLYVGEHLNGMSEMRFREKIAALETELSFKPLSTLESMAKGWEAVWKHCLSLGMNGGATLRGIDTVLLYISELHRESKLRK